MSSISKRFALWGLPNSSKTSFLGTLLHLIKEEVVNPQPPFEMLPTYQAFVEQVWPAKLDLQIQTVRFQWTDAETSIPYDITLLDPPGAFLDPAANLMRCPPPFENMSLYQFYAECDGIIALFDHRTSQGQRAEIAENLGHLFKQLHLINPKGIKPHLVYGLTRFHPDANPSPTQHLPLQYLSHRVIDPQHEIFTPIHASRCPHEQNTFWVLTGFERDNKVMAWQGSTFSVREMLNFLIKPKFHPKAPEQLNVDESLKKTVVHGHPPATDILSPLQNPSLPGIPQTPPPSSPPMNPAVTHGGNTLPSHPRTITTQPNYTVSHDTLIHPTAVSAQPTDGLPRVFVSHNTLDAPFVNPVAQILRQRGIEVWKAPESILPGEDWVDAIERGLSQSTHLLLVISPAAVESDWVRLEMNTAIRLEREGKIKIIPLNYQPCDIPLLWGNYQAINCAKPPQQMLQELIGRLGMAG